MTLFDLTGKTAVITGSSRGIGEAIARRMAEHGANVVVSSRTLDACETVAASINSACGRDAAIAAACNISHKDQLSALLETARGEWGGVDVLVCNAAVNPYYGPSKDIPDEAFDKTMGVNVRSNHWLCNMALPDMIARGGGSIIIVSSVAGLAGDPFLGAYAISKAADFQLARNLAVEYGGANIRANAIAPGIVKTEFAKALTDNPDIARAIEKRLPLARFGEPDEIAGAAVFLASPAGRYVTGQSIVVDGGGMATFL